MTEYHRPRGYCAVCRTNTGPHHLSTARHRRAVFRRDVAMHGPRIARTRPAHLVDPYGSRRDYDAEQAAAAAAAEPDDCYYAEIDGWLDSLTADAWAGLLSDRFCR